MNYEMIKKVGKKLGWRFYSDGKMAIWKIGDRYYLVEWSWWTPDSLRTPDSGVWPRITEIPEWRAKAIMEHPMWNPEEVKE